MPNRNWRPSSPAPPSRVLGVYNITDTSEEELEELMEDYGEIDRVEIMVDETGNSRGFAFVHFHDIEDAVAAKQDLRGHQLRGNTIRLDFRRETIPRNARGNHSRTMFRGERGWQNDYEGVNPDYLEIQTGHRVNDGVCMDNCDAWSWSSRPSSSPGVNLRQQPQPVVEQHKSYCYKNLLEDGTGLALPNKVLVIFGLDPQKTEADHMTSLQPLLTARGTLAKLCMVEDKGLFNGYRPRTYAFAYFDSIVDARLARHELNGAQVDGRSITVLFSKTETPHARRLRSRSGRTSPTFGRNSTSPPPRRHLSAPGPGGDNYPPPPPPGPPPRRHSGYSAPGPREDNYNSRYYDSYIPRPEYNSERSHDRNSGSGYPLSSMSRDEQCSEIFQMIYPMLRKLRF